MKLLTREQATEYAGQMRGDLGARIHGLNVEFRAIRVFEKGGLAELGWELNAQVYGGSRDVDASAYTKVKSAISSAFKRVSGQDISADAENDKSPLKIIFNQNKEPQHARYTVAEPALVRYR